MDSWEVMTPVDADVPCNRSELTSEEVRVGDSLVADVVARDLEHVLLSQSPPVSMPSPAWMAPFRLSAPQ